MLLSIVFKLELVLEQITEQYISLTELNPEKIIRGKGQKNDGTAAV